MATPPIQNIVRLHAAIIAGGVAIEGVNSNGIVSPTNLQAQADPIIAAFDDSANAQASAENIASRAIASNNIDNSRDADDKKLRGALMVAVDEVNLLREWIVSFKAAVAAATSLANLQTRVAALPDMPDRTQQQAFTAIKNKINAGSVD